MKSLVGVLLGAAAIAAIGVGVAELGFRLTEHYSPAYEQVRRTTFEQSRAYQEGTLRDLENLKLEYDRGNDAVKASISSVAQHRMADVDPAILTPELRDWRATLFAAPVRTGDSSNGGSN